VVALQIEKNALKPMLAIEQAIAASLQYLELVVEPFHKAAVSTRATKKAVISSHQVSRVERKASKQRNART
jgi:hypothetical protein